MEPQIQFQEKQTKIYLGKHKITPSNYGERFIELHLVCAAEESSGYNSVTVKGKETMIVENKFVKILTFENIYSMETIKSEIENGFQNIMFFENGGYLFSKKEF